MCFCLNFYVFPHQMNLILKVPEYFMYPIRGEEIIQNTNKSDKHLIIQNTYVEDLEVVYCTNLIEIHLFTKPNTTLNQHTINYVFQIWDLPNGKQQ